MSQTLSCLSTAILDTLPITISFGSFGQLGSTPKPGYFTPLEFCAAVFRTRIRELKPAANTNATKARPATHFFLFVIAFLLSPAAQLLSPMPCTQPEVAAL